MWKTPRFDGRRVAGDGGVVGGHARECGGGKTLPCLETNGAFVCGQLLRNTGIVGRIADHGHVMIILGGCAERMVGPPMSMFSTISSWPTPGFRKGLLEGIRVRRPPGRSVVTMLFDVASCWIASDCQVPA